MTEQKKQKNNLRFFLHYDNIYPMRQLLQFIAQCPDGTSIQTLETKAQFLKHPFQFSVNERNERLSNES